MLPWHSVYSVGTKRATCYEAALLREADRGSDFRGATLLPDGPGDDDHGSNGPGDNFGLLSGQEFTGDEAESVTHEGACNGSELAIHYSILF